MAKTPQIGEHSKSQRGFDVRTFTDRNGHECSVQCSSAIDFEVRGGYENPGTSYLYIGIDDAAPVIMASDAHRHGVQTTETVGWVPYPVPDAVLMHTRMHLSRKQVRSLIKTLNHWLKHGDLEDDE